MWLFNSSIGKKVIMSVTGMCLILFLTFHMAMNAVALFSEEGYNMICELLGANWYAVVATMGLAALAMIHIVYAVILTMQNKQARGTERYAVVDKPAKVEWASQNMLVLGWIILLGLGLHLYNFWWHMMAQELIPGGDVANAANGAYWIRETFSCPGYVIVYLVWIAAIWFHLTHGFWSAFQTLGLNGKTWFCRWKMIGNIWVTVVMLMFIVVALAFAFCPVYKA